MDIKKIDEYLNEKTRQLKSKLRGAKGTQSMWHDFEAITQYDSFREVINSLREQFRVPSDGFSFQPTNPSQEEVEWWDAQPVSDDVDSSLDYALFKLLLEYEFNPFYWLPAIRFYFLYNSVGESEDMWAIGGHCTLEGPGLLNSNIGYPIAIRISPHASKNQIMDFLNKSYSSIIKPLQDELKNPESEFGKRRAKDETINKRNESIYQYRQQGLSHAEIAEKFPGLTYNDISKILSREKKRRIK